MFYKKQVNSKIIRKIGSLAEADVMILAVSATVMRTTIYYSFREEVKECVA